MAANVKYPYTTFFLLFIAFASAFNYYLTYDGIQFNAKLALTYTLDTVEGWIAWYAIQRIIRYLDSKVPYGDNPIRRIVIQVAVTTPVGLAIIIILTEIVSFIRVGRSATIDFYTLDIFIVLVWFLVVNSIYIGIHFYQMAMISEDNRRADKLLKATGFYIKSGRQDLQIPFAEISAFYSDDGFSYLLSTNGKNYITDLSLDKLEHAVPQELFFRLNRKYLFHRDAIKGFKRVGDGKLEVNVVAIGNVPPTIAVSRIRAVEFKKWFRIEEVRE